MLVGANVIYQWHRYEIFDMRSQPSIPSYTGQQVFYNLYINSGEYGIRLRPSLGPAMQELHATLKKAFGPNVKTAKFAKKYIIGPIPKEFADKEVLAYSSEQLLDRVFRAPNWEYFMLLSEAEPDDQVFLRAALEIAEAYPTLCPALYTAKCANDVLHPGYAHTRYNTHPFGPIYLYFLPDAGGVVDKKIAPRALREAQFVPIKIQTDMFVRRSTVPKGFGLLTINWR